jgi:hypothetical protein
VVSRPICDQDTDLGEHFDWYTHESSLMELWAKQLHFRRRVCIIRYGAAFSSIQSSPNASGVLVGQRRRVGGERALATILQGGNREQMSPRHVELTVGLTLYPACRDGSRGDESGSIQTVRRVKLSEGRVRTQDFWVICRLT